MIGLLAGFAAGYLLGARSGRERYDQLRRTFRAVKERPEVQETAGIVTAQVGSAARSAREFVVGRGGRGGAPYTATTLPPSPPPSRNGHAARR
jgi:hypothetical protein